MEKSRYRKTAGSVSNLNYHFVWCPKYRKPVLVDGVAKRLKALLYEKAEALGVKVGGLEIMPDHVHMFITASPTDAPQHFINQFKGYTSRVLRQEFRHLRSRLPCLWSRSYYVGAAGNISADVIQRYIESQKERP